MTDGVKLGRTGAQFSNADFVKRPHREETFIKSQRLVFLSCDASEPPDLIALNVYEVLCIKRLAGGANEAAASCSLRVVREESKDKNITHQMESQ